MRLDEPLHPLCLVQSWPQQVDCPVRVWRSAARHHRRPLLDVWLLCPVADPPERRHSERSASSRTSGAPICPKVCQPQTLLVHITPDSCQLVGDMIAEPSRAGPERQHLLLEWR